MTKGRLEAFSDGTLVNPGLLSAVAFLPFPTALFYVFHPNTSELDLEPVEST